MQKLSDMLFWLRRRKRLQQKQVAAKVGITQSHLAKLESGKEALPGPEVLEALAQLLCSTDDERATLLETDAIVRIEALIEKLAPRLRQADFLREMVRSAPHLDSSSSELMLQLLTALGRPALPGGKEAKN